jgi:hypothetical protein
MALVLVFCGTIMRTPYRLVDARRGDGDDEFCNGPDEVKSPSDRHAAELTLLSVGGAEAATMAVHRSQMLGADSTS